MKTLGLSNGETSSVCLFVDGKLVSAVSEERFSRVKMDEAFPLRALDWLLRHHSLALHDIDEVAYAWKKGFDEGLLAHYTRKAAELRERDPHALEIFEERMASEIDRDQPAHDEFWSWARSELTDEQFRSIRVFYHHEAHALSAALLSPFNDSMVLTIDGRGDFESLTVYEFRRDAAKPLKKVHFLDSSDSLGFFCTAVSLDCSATNRVDTKARSPGWLPMVMLTVPCHLCAP